MPVPFDRPTFEQMMYSLKVSGEEGDILCTHAHEEIEKLQALAGAAPESQGGPFGVIADAHKDGCTNPAVFNCCEDAFRMAKAAPELLAALKDAVEFIGGHNECLEPSAHGSDKEWNDHCVALHKSCQEAINKAEGRAV